MMVVKNGGTLSKKYFQSYFKLIMNTQNCTLEKARELTYDEFFKGNTERFGKETFQHFLIAYEELNKV